MKRTLCFVLFVVGCTADDARQSGRELPDSLGWRYAHVDGADLSFRYPVSRADTVMDRWMPDCTSAQPIYPEEPDSQCAFAGVTLRPG